MNNLLIIVLSLSLSSSLLILALFLFKPLLKNRISKRWQYYIWLVVIVRLLLPLVMETNLVGSAFQKIINETAIVTLEPSELDKLENGQNILYKIDTDSVIQKTTSLNPQSDTFKEIVLSNLWLIWIVVGLIMFIRKITIYQSFVRYIKAGRAEVSDIEHLESFGRIVEEAHIRNAIGLYTNSLISSPLMIGFFRPCIVLPTLDMDKSNFRYTILHELIHYKRRDMFYKWLIQFTICVHWFNPFVYLMGREVNRACELSCDESVIRKLDFDGMRAYGDTLLNAIRDGGNYKDSLASLTLNESKELLKERLDAIMKFKKSSKLVISISLVLTAFICMGATAAGAYTIPKPTLSPTTPWEFMGDSDQPYTYSQSGYYQNAYVFELGWNLNTEGFNAYPDKAKVTLSDQFDITVSFDISCKDYAQNQEALSALTTLIEKLKVQYAGSSLPLKTPLVVSVKYLGDSDIGKLAEEYYRNGELTAFSALFPALDTEIQTEYCNRMFQDNKNAFFSSNLKNMSSDLINTCAEKAYQENNIAFFTNIVPYLTDSDKDAWSVKASKDKKNNFLSVLMP